MRRKFLKYFFFILLLSGCTISNPFIEKNQSPPNMIRVAIVHDADTLYMKVVGPYIIFDASSGQKIAEGNNLKTSLVSGVEQGIQCADTFFKARQVRIVPQNAAAIFINERCYRGEMSLIVAETNKMTVVNTLELEEYLKGVVPKEISDRWPLEAIKAQAIVARTYTLYIKKQKKYPLYDLTSDISSQVYGGQTSEKYRTSLAVERTRSLVLFYGKDVLPSYYHAACGGWTEDVSELWRENLEPLKGGVCAFCKESPHSFWKRNLRLKDIQDKLNAQGYNLGLIREIAVLERNKSQRIKELKIITRDDKEVVISGKDFRNILGPNLIKSNNYVIEMKGYYVDFLGKGWGHGVGLCQWGTNFMARQGYSSDHILKYYYPGVDILPFYDRVQSSP
jgi:stage II sporulation protein D